MHGLETIKEMNAGEAGRPQAGDIWRARNGSKVAVMVQDVGVILNHPLRCVVLSHPDMHGLFGLGHAFRASLHGFVQPPAHHSLDLVSYVGRF